MYRKMVKTRSSCTGILLALLAMAAGIIIFIAIPVIGWVIGGMIIVLSLFIGGKKSKVWRCGNCRHIAARA